MLGAGAVVVTPRGWRIAAVAWDDEREGVTFAPSRLQGVAEDAG